MKKIITVLIVMSFSSICLAQSDDAKSNYYISLNSGYSINSAKNNSYKDAEPGFVKSSKKSVDNALIFSLGGGKRINDNFRISVDFTHIPSSNFVDHLQLEDETNYINTAYSSTSLMANLHYDFFEYNNLTTFVSLGAGMSYNRIDDTDFYKDDELSLKTFSKSSSSFAWNAGLGISYKLMEKANLDFSYKFFNLGKVSTDGNAYGYDSQRLLIDKGNSVDLNKLKSNQILIGIRFNL